MWYWCSVEGVYRWGQIQCGPSKENQIIGVIAQNYIIKITDKTR